MSIVDSPPKALGQDSSTPNLSTMTTVIKTHALRKIYRTGFWMNQVVTTLKSCSIEVFQGETFGLLGPNGAGKTTLLKTLLGIIRPNGGKGTLLGQPLGDRAVKTRIGVIAA